MLYVLLCPNNLLQRTTPAPRSGIAGCKRLEAVVQRKVKGNDRQEQAKSL
jgi:hypothetical protein